eukprot:516140-Ditylum_brightwellii.AAC.4
MGGQLTKDHDAFLKGPFGPKKKGGQKKAQFQPGVSPAVDEDEDSAGSSDGGATEAPAFSAMWGQSNWL